MKRAFLLITSVLLMAISAWAGQKPNIVFILADDLGWGDLGCYGNRFYETPNLDKLAADGMRFTQAYAAANCCSPTRASVLTGRYPARTQVTDWIPGRTPPGTQLSIPRWTNYLRHEETTIAEVLQRIGYGTASIGKWHLGQAGFFPENHGFGLNFAGERWGSHRSMFAPFGGRPKIPNAHNDEYLPDRLTDEPLNFIEPQRDRPFFLYLPHYAVHTPIQGKKELVVKYKTKAGAGETFNAEYAAMLESLDASVGRIVAKLDERNLSRNTMVVFFSDNGGLEKVTSNAPLREGKSTAYEGGIRVPLIVKWPGVVKAKSVSHTPVISNDFFPTFAEAAGISLTPKLAIDGVSLKPLLSGKGRIKRDALYWHYPHYNIHTPIKPCYPHGIIRQGDWKLIEFFEDGRLELFNLKKDLGETTNLSEKEPRVAARLARQLRDWRESVKAQMPSPNPNADPAVFREYVEGRKWQPVGDYEQHTGFAN